MQPFGIKFTFKLDILPECLQTNLQMTVLDVFDAVD